LAVNASKTVWGESHALVLGAEIDVVRGHIAAPWQKRLPLGEATVLACQRLVMRRHLRQLMGQWAYTVCFARSALSLFGEVYTLLGSAGAAEDEMIKLTDTATTELLSAALLAPMLGSSLRARVVPGILCTDASPQGGGLAWAPLPELVAGAVAGQV
jgi:hypothetical protein